MAQDAVEKHLSVIQRLNLDPKGLFVVSVKGDLIRVEYRSNAGELLQVFEGKNGEDLYREISNNDIFSFFVHSAYLGYQISKAEGCIRQGVPYVQDRAPDVK
jgi:dihydropteroate synthase